MNSANMYMHSLEWPEGGDSYVCKNKFIYKMTWFITSVNNLNIRLWSTFLVSSSSQHSTRSFRRWSSHLESNRPWSRLFRFFVIDRSRPRRGPLFQHFSQFVLIFYLFFVCFWRTWQTIHRISLRRHKTNILEGVHTRQTAAVDAATWALYRSKCAVLQEAVIMEHWASLRLLKIPCYVI